MIGRMTKVLAASCLALVAATARADAPKVGDTAKDFTLKTIDGKPVQLSEVNKAGPVVLVVLRGYPGYQCPLCTRQIKEMSGHAKDFAGKKASVVLVYPGPSDKLDDRATEFLGKSTLPEGFTLVTDPDYRFTKDYDLRWDAPKETAYPSTFVIDDAGKITFAKISKTHGDRADSKSILNALAAAK